MKRVREAGLDPTFVREAILPSWWTPECEGDADLLPDVEFMVARFLKVPLADVRDPSRALALPSHGAAHLKATAGIARPELAPAIHAAVHILAATLRNMRGRAAREPLPRDPTVWRQQLQRRGPAPTLDTVATDLWDRGIPVVAVEVLPDGKRFMGLATEVEGSPAIAIGFNEDIPARVLFWLAHEAGHIANGDCRGGGVVVDEAEPDLVDEIEEAANGYGLAALSGHDALAALRGRTPGPLAADAERIGRANGVDPGHMLLRWAEERKREGDERAYALAGSALQQLWIHHGGQRVLRRLFDEHVDVEGAHEDDRSLLRCVRFDPERDATRG